MNSKENQIKCCFCNKPILEKESNDPWPLKYEGRCCQECNINRVVKARRIALGSFKTNKQITMANIIKQSRYFQPNPNHQKQTKIMITIIQLVILAENQLLKQNIDKQEHKYKWLSWATIFMMLIRETQPPPPNKQTKYNNNT